MFKPTVVAMTCGLLAMLAFALCGYNIAVVVPKSMAAVESYAAGSEVANPVTTWDWASILGTLFGGGGLTVASVVATVLAFIQRQAPAVVDRVLPGASDGTKRTVVDVAQITAIQAALGIVKDQPTRLSLLSAGRSAFDDLRDRTFPSPAAESEVAS